VMLTLGADTHWRSHTVVAVDRAGAEFDTVIVVPSPGVHLRVVRWAAQWTERWWAIEASASVRLTCALLDVSRSYRGRTGSAG